MSEPTEYVTVVSCDGFEFRILRSAACLSGAMRKAFDTACMFFLPTVASPFHIDTIIKEMFRAGPSTLKE